MGASQRNRPKPMWPEGIYRRRGRERERERERQKMDHDTRCTRPKNE